jgi:chlorobactene glucosyltransferase
LAVVALALVWALPFVSLLRLARRDPQLHTYPPRRGRPLSVIIPARNEASTIETVVRSVLASDYTPLELVVVDDRSTDETAAIVERLAREDARLRLVRGEPLPSGWYGKPWACVQGARAASGEILVFTDADTRHAPALLSHAVGALEQEQAALVTVAPRQLSLTFWERVVQPQMVLLLAVRYHPRVVNRATRARDIIANGQFIMVTRSGYEAAGTHAAVAGEVAEDLALAQTFFGRGLKQFFGFAEELMETRMYDSLPHLVEGWSKNIYLGGRRSFPEEPVRRALVPVSLTASMLYWLIPPAAVIAALAGAGWAAPLLPAAAIATGLSALFWTLFTWGMGIPAVYGLGYPLGALTVLYIVLRSSWRGGRRVEWRGRVYREGGSLSPRE